MLSIIAYSIYLEVVKIHSKMDLPILDKSKNKLRTVIKILSLDLVYEH